METFFNDIWTTLCFEGPGVRGTLRMPISSSNGVALPKKGLTPGPFYIHSRAVQLTEITTSNSEGRTFTEALGA